MKYDTICQKKKGGCKPHVATPVLDSFFPSESIVLLKNSGSTLGDQVKLFLKRVAGDPNCDKE